MRSSILFASLLAFLPTVLGAINPVVADSSISKRSTYSSIHPTQEQVERALDERKRELGTGTSGFVPSRRSPGAQAVAARHIGRRNRDQALRGTYGHIEARAQAAVQSASPTSYRGVILVKNSDGSSRGYLSPQLNAFGEYSSFTATKESGLIVTFTADKTRASDLNEILAENGETTAYSAFGGAVGFGSDSNDLGRDSYNYIYSTNVGSTGSPGPPVNDGQDSFTAASGISVAHESFVWRFDPSTNALEFQWTQTDGTVFYPTAIGYTQSTIIFTGDIAAVASNFGDTAVLTFTFVPL